MKESNKKCWRSAALILLGISMAAATGQAVSADSPIVQPAAGQQAQVEKVSQSRADIQAQPGKTESQNSSESKASEKENESQANVQQTNQTSGSQSVSAVTGENQEAQTAANQFYNYEYKYAPKIHRGQRRLPVNQRAASRYFSSAARAAAPKYKTFKNKRAYHRVKTVPDEKMQQAVSKAEKTQKVAKAQPEKRGVKQAAPASSESSSFRASVSSKSVKQIINTSASTSSQLNLAVDLGSQTAASQNRKANHKRKANKGASAQEKYVFEQGDKLVKASGGYSRAEVVTIVVLLAGLALSGFAFDEINKKMFN